MQLRPVARGTTRPGGYPAIVNGELTWTEDAQEPGRLLFTATSGGTLFMGEDELVIYIPLDRDFILPPDVADVIRAHAGLIRFERIGREVSVPTVAELDTHL